MFNQFPANSRYHETGTVEFERSNGEKVIYLRRRFVPSPDRFELLHTHTVTQDERLDNIAAKYLDNSELFWRLCDANNAMRPDELTEEVGRELKITLPDGFPGVPSA